MLSNLTVYPTILAPAPPTPVIPVPARLTENTTFYVRQDGSDENNGLVDDATNAFGTLPGAISKLRTVNFGGYNCLLQVQAGTWNLTDTLDLGHWTPNGRFTLRGNTSNPTAHVIQASFNGVLISLDSAYNISVQGFNLRRSSTNNLDLIYSQHGCYVNLTGNNYGSAGGGTHIYGRFGALFTSGAYWVSGGAGTHVWLDNHALAILAATTTVTITTSVSFGQWAFLGQKSTLSHYAVTFVNKGFVSGKKWDVGEFSDLSAANGSNGIPGTIAGTAHVWSIVNSA